MNRRDSLIAQVKEEYARRADRESRDSFVGLPGDMTSEAYYEKLLNDVLAAIGTGRFDGFTSGKEVVEAVADNRERWGIHFG